MVRLPGTDSNNFISLHLCSVATLSDWSRQTQHLGCILVTDGTRHNDVVGHALCDAAGAEDVIARSKATRSTLSVRAPSTHVNNRGMNNTYMQSDMFRWHTVHATLSSFRTGEPSFRGAVRSCTCTRVRTFFELRARPAVIGFSSYSV